MKRILLYLPALLCTVAAWAGNVVWYDGVHPVGVSVAGEVSPVVDMALDMFADDLLQVTGLPVDIQRGKAPSDRRAKAARICLVQLDRATDKQLRAYRQAGVPTDSICKYMDAFFLRARKNALEVFGNNGRGTAYGLLEISRLAGVSPWVWWGDVVPERRTRLELPDSFATFQAPSVRHRGVFINDEDWSTRPWAETTVDRAGKGVIGPKTYERIFQLLLRLRANTIWPAMHEGTKAFFLVEGNREMASRYGIFVGTSHCEPLLRNNPGEWDVKARGSYNFISNRQAVVDYWTERLSEVKGMDCMFTIGMRGIHDGRMEGVKTLQEQTDALQRVIDEQRRLLAEHVGKDVTAIPQIFVPYKEVLEVMENGLRVPDDVTLVWCDDNYGYLTRLPDGEQQRRKGGHGVYYHLSYWGRPHDYLWLTTTQPGLIYHQMRQAYDHQARSLWIANIHDPKVAGYDLELFLDMAWNIGGVSASTLASHLQATLVRDYGEKAGTKLTEVMHAFYRLCGERRPEFMGWTQVELDKRKFPRGLSPVTDTEFSATEFGNETDRYLRAFRQLCQAVDSIGRTLRPELRDAFFAGVEYKVKGAALMAGKILTGSHAAYDSILALTEEYNRLKGGKWQGLMDCAPRRLPVFGQPLDRDGATAAPSSAAADVFFRQTAYPIPASGYASSSVPLEPVQMLGHSMSAVPLPKGESAAYDVQTSMQGTAVVRVAVIPTQSLTRGDIRLQVSVDNKKTEVFSLREPFRSEQWKLNVLRGQRVFNMRVGLCAGHHRVTVTALDDNVVLDQLMIDYMPGRKFYLLDF